MRVLWPPHKRNHHIGTGMYLLLQFNRLCSLRVKRGKVIAKKAWWFVASWFQCEERRTAWYGMDRSREVVQLENSRAMQIQLALHSQKWCKTNRNCSVTSENILAKPVSSTIRSSSDPEIKVACSIRGIDGPSNNRVILMAPPRALRALVTFL